jgi:hypothetical protein
VRRRWCALAAAALCLGSATAVTGAASAAPGTPLWRWDYGLDSAGHPDLANVTALGLGTSGRIQLGFADGTVQRVTATGEHSGTSPADNPVTAVATDGVHDFVARSGTSKISVYDRAGTAAASWNTFITGGRNAAIAVSPNDPYWTGEVVWVADSTTVALTAFSPDGNLLGAFGVKAAGIKISGMAVAPDGTLLLLDGQHGYVQRLSSQGVPMGRFGALGSGNGQFSNATGIAVDAKGTVFVADTGNGRIDEFSASDGSYLGQFGAPTTYTGAPFGAGDFVAPAGLAVDCVGRLHVLDIAPAGGSLTQPTGRVAVYTGVAAPTGTCYGPASTAFAGPARPGATGVDKAGNVYVATDTAIRKYTAAGALITSWSSAPSGAGHWTGVLGLTVAPNGDVWLVDQASHVLHFRSAGALIRNWVPVPGANLSSIAVRASDGHVLLASASQWVREYTTAGSLVRTLSVHDIAGDGSALPLFVSVAGTTTLIVAMQATGTDTAVERFGVDGSYLDQFRAPRRDAGDSSIGPVVPYPGGGYAFGVIDTTGNGSYDPQTQGLVRVGPTGAVLGRLAETRLAPRQPPTTPAPDCAGRLVFANYSTGQVVRLSTSSAVCRWLPTAVSGAVTARTTNRLTVSAAVNPSAQVTKVRVQYGPTTRYGLVSAWVSLPSDNISLTRTIALPGLAHAHSYHYRVQAVNPSGTVYGADRVGRTS